MKPTVIVIVTFVTALMIGMGSIQFYHRLSSTEQGQSQVAQQPNAHTALVDRREPMKLIASHQTGTEAVENNSQPIRAMNVNAVDTNRLEAVGIKQRLMKRGRNYEYWAWRVDVKNNTDDILTVYVEIEWLDEDGFRVTYTNEVRKIEPGIHPISEVHMMGVEEAAKAKTVRIVKLNER